LGGEYTRAEPSLAEPCMVVLGRVVEDMPVAEEVEHKAAVEHKVAVEQHKVAVELRKVAVGLRTAVEPCRAELACYLLE